jgi:cyclopropane-fatty-acyl-phospholipid synthase
MDTRRKPETAEQAPDNPHIERLLRTLLGDDLAGLRIEAYDGTRIGPSDSATVVRILSPNFFHRIMTGRLSELAFVRAFVAGDYEIDGDVYGVLEVPPMLDRVRLDRGLIKDAAAILGLVGVRDLTKLRPLPTPPEEVRPRGRLHSRKRDARAISSHYDVSNDFYGLFLDDTMTYSCAVFEHDSDTLETAQRNKYDLICRKLGLQEGMRLLDIGCGWGGMVRHAAEHYGVEAVGITISRQQREYAEKRVAGAGLADRVEIRLQDYRDISDGPFDAISSIGMFEHVGERCLRLYFDQVESLLARGGRLLNQAINRPQPLKHARVEPDGLIGRYVFPDGELLETGQVVSAISRSGLEVRHVESLREHYARTLRAWVERLEENWPEAVALTSAGRARVWRLYMASCARGFELNEFTISQILATKTTDGASGMSLRPHW